MSSFFEFDPDNLPEEMPENIKQTIRDQADRAHMRTQAGYHDVNMFLEGLNEEQLRMLQRVVWATSSSAGSSGYYAGRIDAELKMRFDICSCGEKHDPTTELLSSANMPSDPDTEPTVKLGEPTFSEMHPADQNRIKNDYHIAQDRHGYWRCTLCGMRYVSVEDRMLRPTDHCYGCFSMEGNGAPMGPRPGDSDW